MLSIRGLHIVSKEKPLAFLDFLIYVECWIEMF